MLDEAFPKGYQAFNFESGQEYKVAVCTGSAALEIDEVYAQGYNMFITGEVRESTPIFAQEHNMAVIAAGHHRTEVFCVQNLAKWINANCSGVEAKFIDIDNPV
jgi:putative NIF3 family GTP cyclohydrolase 1 type 2